MMLSLACVIVESFGLPSVVIWGDRGKDQCCGLSKVWMVETVGFRQVMWLVMLKYAKDRVLGVDTSDNRCRHVSGTQRLAYLLGML
jgi:hypothetical protein